MRFSCYNEKELRHDIENYSFEADDVRGGLIFAPLVSGAEELPEIVKFMKEEMKLVIMGVEALDFMGDIDYYITFRKNHLRLVKG